MKKILILIFTLFLLTGCYDYNEINKLEIITAVGVDYQNDEYIITLEILNDKVEKESAKVTSYTKTGSATTLAKAIENATSKLTDKAIYNHVKLMVLSKSITEDKIKNIIDYFLRSTYFRENFYVITSLDNPPEEILQNTTDKDPIASSTILEMLESNNYASNSAILKTFDQIIEEVIAFGIDTCFSNITLKDESFQIDGASIFHGYDFKSKITNEEATLYNILTDNFYRPIISKKYDDLYFSIAVATGKIEFTIKDGIINASGSYTGKIMDNEPNFDIRNLEVIKDINKDFQEILNQEIKEFIQMLQKNNSDILGINQSYYKKTRIKEEDYWLNLEVDSHIEFYINKKGLIYEVTNED